MKKVFFIIVTVIILAVLGVLLYAAFDKEEEILPEQTEDEESMDINFSETGNLTEGTYQDWRLVYEEPGAPALFVELIFTEQSMCNIGEGEQKCTEIKEKLEIGQRVSVLGEKQQNMLKVHTLEDSSE